MSISEFIKTADFKAEKHVPVIEAPEKVNAGEPVNITVSVGKEIPHPNTTEHFINWIALFYKSDDNKFTTQIGRAEFLAHGESTEGANKGAAFTEPHATFCAKLLKSGTLIAVSYCNIHGLWESSKKITM